MTTPLYQLHDFGMIAIDGSDAAKFLQGQLTCNLDKLGEGQHSLAAFCNPKGRIIGSFILWRQQNIYYLIQPQDNLNKVLSGLQKYALFSKVSLNDVSGNYQLYGSLQQSELATCLSLSDTGPYLLISPTALDAQTDNHAWHSARLQASVAFIYADTSEHFTPHDINYPTLGAVAFDKGCYVGQEVIARMQHLGKLKKHLYYGTLSQASARNSVLQSEGKSCGHIVESIHDNNKQHVLAVINDQAAVRNNVLYQNSPLCITKCGVD